MIAADQIIHQIAGGSCDGYLDAIKRAIENRKETIALAKVAMMKPNDEVKISGNVRPKYLLGERAKVVAVIGDQVKVFMNRQVGKFSQSLTVPASCVEKC
jgi:hypothetical protein